jgi:hypothetical protein
MQPRPDQRAQAFGRYRRDRIAQGRSRTGCLRVPPRRHQRRNPAGAAEGAQQQGRRAGAQGHQRRNRIQVDGGRETIQVQHQQIGLARGQQPCGGLEAVNQVEVGKQISTGLSEFGAALCHRAEIRPALPVFLPIVLHALLRHRPLLDCRVT